jgi:hypothetical protein
MSDLPHRDPIAIPSRSPASAGTTVQIIQVSEESCKQAAAREASPWMLQARHKRTLVSI